MSEATPQAPRASDPDTGFAGHPRGLMTLFFTEMWERFSYYGMRALLVLYMTAAVTDGGLGFDAKKAGLIYGLYTSMVYAMSIPGGWLADRFLGQQRSVLIGGILIALGHFSMIAVPLPFFYGGLVLIVLGTGLLKPNISTIVGQLYSAEDHRRDAGFSIFYMGINLGALIAPIVTGYLAQRIYHDFGWGQPFNWHWGFGAAGVGMTFGLVQYVRGKGNLRGAGAEPVLSTEPVNYASFIAPIARIAIYGIIAFWALPYFDLPPRDFGLRVLVFFIPVVIELFRGFFTSVEDPTEKKRIWAIALLFIFSTLFWGAFEQAGSSLNLFADRLTNCRIFGHDFPSSWFQSANSFFIVIGFAPLFAWLWVRLGKREPSSPTKFAYGLLFVGLGFLPVAWASNFASPEHRVGISWLVVLYLFHTIGELCLSPVGLSTVTKLAPRKILASMMGVWFLSLSLGNYIGGQVAGLFESFPLPKLFGAVFLTTTVAAIVLVFLVKPIRNLMGGVH